MIGSEFSSSAETLAAFHKQLSERISQINQQWYDLALPELYLRLPQINTAAVSEAAKAAERVKSIVHSLNENWVSRIESATAGLSEIGRRMVADFAAMGLAWDELVSSDALGRLQVAVKMKEDEVGAFCTAGWPVAPSMPSELRERVVQLHREGKTRYVSQSIMGYYRRRGHRNLVEVVTSWERNPLFAPRLHIILDALEAHRSGKYTLSVPALVPQIEGVLSDYVHEQHLAAKFGKIQQVYTAAIGDVDDYGLAEWAIVQTLLHLLQTSTYVYTSFEDELKKSRPVRRTTRHTVLHGIDTNYHRQSHSLRERSFFLMRSPSWSDWREPGMYERPTQNFERTRNRVAQVQPVVRHDVASEGPARRPKPLAIKGLPSCGQALYC